MDCCIPDNFRHRRTRNGQNLHLRRWVQPVLWPTQSDPALQRHTRHVPSIAATARSHSTTSPGSAVMSIRLYTTLTRRDAPRRVSGVRLTSNNECITQRQISLVFQPPDLFAMAALTETGNELQQAHCLLHSSQQVGVVGSPYRLSRSLNDSERELVCSSLDKRHDTIGR